MEDFALFKARFAQMILEMRGHLSQREFAQVLGVSQSAIQAWESQASLPNLENLSRIAAYRKQTTESLVSFLFSRSIESVNLTMMERIEQMSLLELARLNQIVSQRIIDLSGKLV